MLSYHNVLPGCSVGFFDAWCSSLTLSVPYHPPPVAYFSQGKPFGIEIVDLDGDGRVDILCSNHQTDGTATWPSAVAGRVYALEQPTSGNVFVDDWTTHILLDDIRPNPSLPGSRSSRLAPGAASAIYPGGSSSSSKPWIVVGGDEASKVWVMSPVPNQDWMYDSEVIFDINEFYGPETSQTPQQDPFGITISTIGKVTADDSVTTNGDIIIYVPVFEARDIHVFRLSVVADTPTPWVYELPNWWDAVQAANGSENLRRCYKRQFPPTQGSTCATRIKICYFGDQTCSGGDFPATKCTCNGSQNVAGAWNCEPEACPASS